MKFLNCIRLNFSHLIVHKFCCNSGDSVTANSSCNTEIEIVNHFLRDELHTILGRKLLSTIYHIRPKTSNFLVILCLSDNHDVSIKSILEATVKYIDEK